MTLPSPWTMTQMLQHVVVSCQGPSKGAHSALGTQPGPAVTALCYPAPQQHVAVGTLALLQQPMWLPPWSIFLSLGPGAR